MSVLLEGRSGAGKTRLVSQLADSLYKFKNIGYKGVLFLPQRPLLARGGLAAQISYPIPTNVFGLPETSGSRKETEKKFREILEKVGLTNLLDRVGGDWKKCLDWEKVLSPGEKQRLVLTRIFFHCPNFAVLDESTSGIGEDMEDEIYRQIQELGISLISVSHKTRLRKFHKNILRLNSDGNGSWTFEKTGKK